MKKLFFKLSFIAVIIFTFYACLSDNELNADSKENFSATARSAEPFERGKIGAIRNNEATPLYDDIFLKTSLINEGFFTSIESVDLVYGFNPDRNEHEAFLTIIGQGSDGSSTVSLGYDIDLTIDGTDLYIENPDIVPNLFKEHTCTGNPCSSCKFIKGGFWNLKILGCECNGQGSCNHSVRTEGLGGAVKTLIAAAAAVA